jgi:acyl-CoA hydrolase
MDQNALQARITASETRIAKTVFPGDTNHHGTLFGGTAIQLMAEAAFIAGTRFARKKMVLVSSGRIDFHIAIPPGSIIELVARVEKVGRTSLEMSSLINVETTEADGFTEAACGRFTFVCVTEEMKPVKVLGG